MSDEQQFPDDLVRLQREVLAAQRARHDYAQRPDRDPAELHRLMAAESRATIRLDNHPAMPGVQAEGRREELRRAADAPDGPAGR